MKMHLLTQSDQGILGLSRRAQYSASKTGSACSGFRQRIEHARPS